MAFGTDPLDWGEPAVTGFCPVRVWLDKPGKPQVTGPDAQDDVHCTVTQRFQIRVECKKE